MTPRVLHVADSRHPPLLEIALSTIPKFKMPPAKAVLHLDRVRLPASSTQTIRNRLLQLLGPSKPFLIIENPRDDGL
jgi:hypothetical protein